MSAIRIAGAAAYGFAAVFLTIQAGHSAEVKVGVGKSGQATIWITGEIVPGDADRFSAAVKQANDSGKYVANVRLDSPGGNLLEGAKIADAIRFGKMSTNVGKTAFCASACFLMFAAGSQKNVSYGAQIGVHGASGENGEETVASGAATVSMAKMAKELGVPPAIIGRMVVTAPSDMVWLTPQDLQSMGTTMMGKPSQVAANPPPVSLEPGQMARQTPQQTRPSDPMSLAPTSKSPPTWDDFVTQVVLLSARQNGGKANSMRTCQPELKVCFNGVWFKMDGTDAMIKVTKDMNDRIIHRELCTFNSSFDIRTCMDWDTEKKHRDMKDANGDWSKVADE
ncbi:hypothetical protein QA635_18640 [Bradyrhizobium brasilense]|uniref:COG3904 family protein n=1 Tax=Bradyrhizobium brasilense TaxID=1419277 RepID=UPI0024B2068A|nr:hypothetical protein [Bradyrhizobium australafricanum]WFU36315.1 hypothetical protein QA635_18640 [Bradyrhizobium australafricanum]